MPPGKLKSLFGAGSSSASETETAAGKETAGEESAKADPERIDAPKRKTSPKDTIPLDVSLRGQASLSMNPSEKKIARDRCFNLVSF